MNHLILKRLSLSGTPINNYGLFCITNCNLVGNCARVCDRQSLNDDQKTLSFTVGWNRATDRQAVTARELNNYQKQDRQNLCFVYLSKRTSFYFEQRKENFSLFLRRTSCFWRIFQDL